jgi:two-component system, cell cycle sensor histidine kinase and response regulator CckA
VTTHAGSLANPEFTAALARALATSDAAAVLVIGPDLVVEDANPAAALALGGGNLPAGTPLSGIVDAADLERFRRAISDGPAGTPLLLRAAVAPGDPDRALLVSLVQVPAGASGAARLVAIGRPAGPDLRREARILRAQRYEIVGQLTSGVAHDLNNRLSTVTTFSDLMLGDAEPGSQDAEDLAEIKRAGLDAATITRKLDLFAGGHAGGATESSLPEVVRGFEKLIRRFIGTEITLVTELDDACAPVDSPPIRIEEVLIALVSNARDAMPEGGTLTIRARPDASDTERVVLEVHDTGPEHVLAPIEQALEAFFSSRSPSVGSGLGLATVHGILDALGGTIEMVRESRAPGTTVRVTLPGKPGHETEADDAAAEAAPPSPGALRVGLIEPDDRARGALERGLTGAGALVTPFASPEAFSRAAPTVDAVVADVPDDQAAGVRLLRSIRPGDDDVPVVVLRRRASPRVMPPGTANVLELAKPTDLQAIRAALTEISGGGTPQASPS